jgi:hypothetical protein
MLDVSCGFISDQYILAQLNTDTNHFNVGALMERGIKLVGCGQAPVQKCRFTR